MSMLFSHKFDGYTFKHMLNTYPAERTSMLCEHFHMNYELLYFIRGKVRFEIEARQYILQPNTLLIIKPGMHHQAIVDPSTDYERIVINFSLKDIPPILAEPLSRCPSALDVGGTEVETLFSVFGQQRQKYENETLLQEMRKCTLTQILLILCFQDSKCTHVEYLNRKLSTIIEYIENNLPHINSVEDIAKGVFISESTIRKLFSDNSNVPVMTYVRAKKIMMARELIFSGVKPQKACEQCGFQDYSTFYRSYKKQCGESPSDTYRSITENASLQSGGII